MKLKSLVVAVTLMGVALSLVAFAPTGLTGQSSSGAVTSLAAVSRCNLVGGVLMTNIGAIPFGPNGATNLGPVFGDLAGSVAASPLAPPAIGYHHYWITAAGDTINFKDALLNADPTDFLENGTVVAVRWGHYRSVISGGTGKFQGVTGYLDYFGLADFNATDPGTNQSGLTLVLRYRGEVCYAR